MELPVRIVSVSELKDSTFTTRQGLGGETKLLSKREFIINDGYGEIACEMLCDAHALLHDVFCAKMRNKSLTAKCGGTVYLLWQWWCHFFCDTLSVVRSLAWFWLLDK